MLEQGLLEGDQTAQTQQTQGEPRDARRHGYVPPPRRQEWYHAAAILVAELVGTGVLALPHTFAVIGVAAGVAVLLVFALLSLYSGILLHRLQSWYPQGITYGDMAHQVIGVRGRQIVFGFIYVAFFGNLAIYVLTCAEALQSAFYGLRWCKWWYTVVTIIFLLPFCQLRTLHNVSYAAAASAVAIFVALAIILVVTFADQSPQDQFSSSLDLVDFPDLPIGGLDASTAAADLSASPSKPTFFRFMSAMTTAIFAFGGQGLYFETMAEMRQPSDFPRAVTLTTVGILAVYLLVALSCVSVYGDKIDGSVLYALPDGPAKSVAALLLFFHVSISYVLAQQVIGRAIHVRWKPHHVDRASTSERGQWFCISVSLLLMSFLIANGIPFFSHLMGVVAAVSTAPLTFGIPAIMVYVASHTMPKPANGEAPYIRRWEYPVLVFLVILTVYLVSAGLASNIHELVEKWSSVGKPFDCHLPKR
ncbi:Proton-coupled amino acid transporter 4 [Hondaea fermentalgiana]|uniref:Proton-coupled amino acid transporter 4 n=1 Tax=Hondaea fermentalgiana TaxID=2315210 RepID=A0A2R5GJQ7_9STRA|nr:Proton-coupled amino acid transporter 4 [Hondaea fermentalgiana]|eukprot:GBG28094.1 Proton-coupled amino acid transporter 4 [Hondaea fermentalgiana]